MAVAISPSNGGGRVSENSAPSPDSSLIARLISKIQRIAAYSLYGAAWSFGVGVFIAGCIFVRAFIPVLILKLLDQPIFFSSISLNLWRWVRWTAPIGAMSGALIGALDN